jgi:gliding motility-associated-like protein
MRHTPIFLLLALLVAGRALAGPNPPVPDDGPSPVPDQRVPTQAPHFELIENKNQWESQVRYRADIPGGFLQLKNQGWVYVFYDQEKLSRLRHGRLGSQQAFMRIQEDPTRVRAHGVEVSFVDANPGARMEASQEIGNSRNYFLGDQSRWATEVRSYAEVTYRQIYRGVDMRLMSRDASLKYEFEVAPGTNPRQIKLRYQGAQALRIDADGHLIVGTSLSDITETKPYSYQIVDGRRVEVPSRFRLRGEVLSYEFPEGYDKDLPLVIDPRLIFSTYSGSLADNWGNTATFDNEGNLYSGGTAFSTGFPVTIGAFDITFNGAGQFNTDVAILKFSPDGTRLLYATYLGGGDSEIPHSMIVNNAGQLVIYGTTSSLNFPTGLNAYDRSFNGGTPRRVGVAGEGGAIGGVTYARGSDIFVSILSNNGSQLVNSTYVGGSGNDGIAHTGDAVVRNYGDELRGEVIVDQQNNVYIASCTRSADFPTQNAAQAVNRGSLDGVVFRLSADLTALNWSTYYGGGNLDDAFSLQISRQGDIYVAGGTTSTNLTVSANALRGSNPGGNDGFVARYSNSGAFLGATYLGTERFDQAYFVDLDGAGDVYVFGTTNGSYPVSSGVYTNPNSGQFIHKINPALTNSIFSTVVGASRGIPDISPTAFLVNECGNIYIAGWGGVTGDQPDYATGSQLLRVAGMPTTADAIRRGTNGDDFYLMLLSPEARSLVYGTFIGGNSITDGDHVDGGTSRFDPRGIIYHATCACRDNNFPTTPGVFSNTNRAASFGCNIASFRIDIDDLRAAFLITDPSGAPLTSACAPAEVRFPNRSVNGITYTWDIRLQGSTTPLLTSANTDERFTFTTPGTYVITLTARNNAICRQDVTQQNLVIGTGSLVVSPPATLCPGETVQLNATGGTTYQWSPATGLSNPNIANPVASPTSTTTYTVRSQTAQGCQLSSTVTVTVNNIQARFTTQIQNRCDSLPTVTFTNTSQNASDFSWDLGAGRSFTGTQPPPQRYPAGTYRVILTARSGVCVRRDTSIFTIAGWQTISLSAPPVICQGQSTQLRATGGANSTYLWSPGTGLSSTTVANPTANPATTTRYAVRITDGPSGCFRDTSILVTVVTNARADFDVVDPDPCFNDSSVRVRNNGPQSDGYRWNFGDGRTFAGFQPPPIRYTRSGTYLILLTIGQGSCQSRDSATVNVALPPRLQITPDTAVCARESVQLQASGGDQYAWTPTAGLSNPNIANPVATPAQTTRYTVRITSANNCAREASVTVTVRDQVQADFDIVGSDLCFTDSIVRVRNNGPQNGNYRWDFGDGRTFVGFQPVPIRYPRAGTYLIVLTSTLGRCQSRDSATVSVQFAEPVRISPDTTLCFNESVQLQASGGTRYAWTPTAGLSNPNIANPVANPTQTTRYTVRITSANGCVREAAVTVTVRPRVQANFRVETLNDCDPFPTIRLTNLSEGGVDYLWDLGDGRTFQGFQPPPFKYTREGNFQIRLTARNGRCDSQNASPVNVVSSGLDVLQRNVRVSPTQVICTGQAGTTLTASGGVRYLWSPAAGLSNANIANPVATPTQTTRYGVRIFNSAGCFVDTAVTVEVVPAITVNFDAVASADCGRRATVQVTNRSTGGETYRWILGNGDTLRGPNPPPFTYERSGVYDLTLEATTRGCVQRRTIRLEVENVLPPNVITPNGDGRNDLFVINNVRQGWKLDVFDRWGKRVFQSDNYQGNWGAEANNATYFYLLTSPEGRTCKGWVQVLRGNN